MRTGGLYRNLTLATILLGAFTAALTGAESAVQTAGGSASVTVTGGGSAQTVVSMTAGDGGTTVALAGRTLCGVLSQGKEAAARLGHFGCLVIGTKARWQARSKQFAELGWTPGLKNLDTIDFTQQRLVVLFCAGVTDTNVSSVLSAADGTKPPQVELSLTYPAVAPAAELGMSLSMISFAPAQQAKVSVYTVGAGTRAAAAEKKLAWSARFGDDAADVVDGLQGRIRPKAATVNSGEDIEVEFTLRLADFAVDKTGWLAPPGGVVRVWDGKYSNGYRNHAFEVTTPDGAVHLLRPGEKGFDKNAPHPIVINADAPYILPEWVEGVTFKSLKALGLDTAQAGKYVITGLYEERGGLQKDWNSGKDVLLWGGSLASNTITVEVVAR